MAGTKKEAPGNRVGRKWEDYCPQSGRYRLSFRIGLTSRLGRANLLRKSAIAYCWLRWSGRARHAAPLSRSHLTSGSAEAACLVPGPCLVSIVTRKPGSNSGGSPCCTAHTPCRRPRTCRRACCRDGTGGMHPFALAGSPTSYPQPHPATDLLRHFGVSHVLRAFSTVLA